MLFSISKSTNRAHLIINVFQPAKSSPCRKKKVHASKRIPLKGDAHILELNLHPDLIARNMTYKPPP